MSTNESLLGHSRHNFSIGGYAQNTPASIPRNDNPNLSAFLSNSIDQSSIGPRNRRNLEPPILSTPSFHFESDQDGAPIMRSNSRNTAPLDLSVLFQEMEDMKQIIQSQQARIRALESVSMNHQSQYANTVESMRDLASRALYSSEVIINAIVSNSTMDVASFPAPGIRGNSLEDSEKLLSTAFKSAVAAIAASPSTLSLQTVEANRKAGPNIARSLETSFSANDSSFFSCRGPGIFVNEEPISLQPPPALTPHRRRVSAQAQSQQQHDIQDRLESLESAVKAIMEDAAKSRDGLDTFSASHESTSQRLDDRIDVLTADFSVLSSDLLSSKTDVVGVQSQASELRNAVTDIDNRVRDVGTALCDVKSAINVVSEAIGMPEDRPAVNILNSIAILEGKLQASACTFDSRVLTVENLLQSMSSSLQEFEGKLKSHVSGVHDAISKPAPQNDVFESQLKSIIIELSELKHASKEQSAEIIKFREESDSLHSMLSSVKSSVRTELEEISNYLDDFRRKERKSNQDRENRDEDLNQSISKKLSGFYTTLQSLEGEITACRDVNHTLAKRISTSQQSIDTVHAILQNEIGTRNHEVDELKTHLTDSISSLVHRIQINSSEFDERIKTAGQNVHSLQKQVESNSGTIKENKHLLSEQQALVQYLADELKDSTSLIEDLIENNRLESLSKIEALESKITSVTTASAVKPFTSAIPVLSTAQGLSSPGRRHSLSSGGITNRTQSQSMISPPTSPYSKRLPRSIDTSFETEQSPRENFISPSAGPSSFPQRARDELARFVESSNAKLDAKWNARIDILSSEITSVKQSLEQFVDNAKQEHSKALGHASSLVESTQTSLNQSLETKCTLFRQELKILVETHVEKSQSDLEIHFNRRLSTIEESLLESVQNKFKSITSEIEPWIDSASEKKINSALAEHIRSLEEKLDLGEKFCQMAKEIECKCVDSNNQIIVRTTNEAIFQQKQELIGFTTQLTKEGLEEVKQEWVAIMNAVQSRKDTTLQHNTVLDDIGSRVQFCENQLENFKKLLIDKDSWLNLCDSTISTRIAESAMENEALLNRKLGLWYEEKMSKLMTSSEFDAKLSAASSKLESSAIRYTTSACQTVKQQIDGRLKELGDKLVEYHIAKQQESQQRQLPGTEAIHAIIDERILALSADLETRIPPLVVDSILTSSEFNFGVDDKIQAYWEGRESAIQADVSKRISDCLDNFADMKAEKLIQKGDDNIELTHLVDEIATLTDRGRNLFENSEKHLTQMLNDALLKIEKQFTQLSAAWEAEIVANKIWKEDFESIVESLRQTHSSFEAFEESLRLFEEEVNPEKSRTEVGRGNFVDLLRNIWLSPKSILQKIESCNEKITSLETKVRNESPRLERLEDRLNCVDVEIGVFTRQKVDPNASSISMSKSPHTLTPVPEDIDGDLDDVRGRSETRRFRRRTPTDSRSTASLVASVISELSSPSSTKSSISPPPRSFTVDAKSDGELANTVAQRLTTVEKSSSQALLHLRLLQSEHDSLKSDLSSLHTEHDHLLADVSAIKSNELTLLPALKSSSLECDSRLSTLERSILAITEDVIPIIASSKGRLDSWDSTIPTLVLKVGSVSDAVSDLNNRLDDAEVDLEAMKETVVELCNEKDELDASEEILDNDEHGGGFSSTSAKSFSGNGAAVRARALANVSYDNVLSPAIDDKTVLGMDDLHDATRIWRDEGEFHCDDNANSGQNQIIEWVEGEEIEIEVEIGSEDCSEESATGDSDLYDHIHNSESAQAQETEIYEEPNLREVIEMSNRHLEVMRSVRNNSSVSVPKSFPLDSTEAITGINFLGAFDDEVNDTFISSSSSSSDENSDGAMFRSPTTAEPVTSPSNLFGVQAIRALGRRAISQQNSNAVLSSPILDSCDPPTSSTRTPTSEQSVGTYPNSRSGYSVRELSPTRIPRFVSPSRISVSLAGNTSVTGTLGNSQDEYEFNEFKDEEDEELDNEDEEDFGYIGTSLVSVGSRPSTPLK